MNESLTIPIKVLLGQLESMLTALSDEEYTRRIVLLSDASIGQHTRHILEFFIQLFLGYESGTVNYDHRKRDLRIETSRGYACRLLRGVAALIDYADKPLLLEGEFGAVPSNFHRELVYNGEHITHHMALMRIGVNAVSSHTLPDDFGVARSTLKFRNACAR